MRTAVVFIVVLAAMGGCVAPDEYDFASEGGEPAPLYTPADLTDEDMDGLLALWRKYEMPEPPQDAPLVICTHGGTTWYSGVKQKPAQSLAFMLRDGGTDAPSLFLIGTIEVERDDFVSAEKVDGSRLTLSEVNQRNSEFGRIFRYSSTFATGIQCWARGYKGIARELTAKDIGEEFSTVRDNVRQPTATTPRETLGTVVWGYWFNSCFRPESDRAAAVTHLKNAVGDFACLKTPEDGAAAHWHDIYEDMIRNIEHALEPSKAKLGSVQADIDALANVCLSLYDFRVEWMPESPHEDPLPAPLRNLLQRGFDAVPELLAHVDDRRFTRSTSTPTFNGTTAPLHVGNLVVVILQAMANADVTPTWTWNEELQVSHMSYDKVRDWWNAVRDTNEAEYLISTIEFGRSDVHFSWYFASDRPLFLILGHKYPDKAGELYEQHLQPDDSPTREMLYTVAHGKLNHEEKLRLLTKGARATYSRHSHEALREIHPLDPQAFETLLIECLDAMDGKLERKSPLYSNAIRYTLLTKLTTNGDVWDALTRLAQRAEPALRVRIIGRFGYRGEEITDRDRWLRFIAQFIRDDDVRRREDDVTQCDPVLDWGTIRVGDVAALRIGEILQLEATPDPEWKDTQWRKFTHRVIGELEDLGIEVPDA